MIVQPTSENDRVCLACPSGYTSTGLNSESCVQEDGCVDANVCGDHGTCVDNVPPYVAFEREARNLIISLFTFLVYHSNQRPNKKLNDYENLTSRSNACSGYTCSCETGYHEQTGVCIDVKVFVSHVVTLECQRLVCGQNCS